MNTPPDKGYEFRARIGVGASLGALLGAALGALFFTTPQAVIISSLLGAGLGAAVGSRLRSQAFQFIWIEYSRDVARRLFISVFLFLAPFSLFIYFLIVGTTPAIEILLLSATSMAALFFIYTVGYVISQLDDLLRKIILEAIALGFGLSLFFFLTLGLLSLAFPIPSNWLVAFIIMGTSMLIGRFVVAVKYR
ncbi:MAG: hypothetical protein MUO58_16625 [Anaerolineales bacterium]|nr:hypothetical protein [Anaerolineales bacterium]